MPTLTPDGRHLVETLATRYQVGTEAVVQLLHAVAAGGGRQAQFNHPELGGMGQWASGGMIMIGDMFNNALKYRVDALCNDLAAALATASPFVPRASGASPAGANHAATSRWPADLGNPSSTGSQNSMAYAVFPASRRLAVEQAGRVTVYDTGDHHIGGVSQQQDGDQTLTFTSQFGLVRLSDLPVVPARGEAPPTAPADIASPPRAAAPAADPDDSAIFAKLERLAELAQKGVITSAEFAAKKAELLARL